MTTTKTADVDGTLQQIYDLAMAGCDIVRCTCNEIEAAEGLARIVPRSPVPIVADIHHQYRMALAALEAGVHCLRLNPGNIRRPEHIKLVAQEAKDRGVPIRIGVNGGSLHPDLYKKYGGKVTPEAMVESAQMELAYFDEVGFERREDLGQGLVGAADDRGLPAARRRRRPPAAPRRHRGRAAAGRHHQGHGRHRHAAGRGHRRHDPLQPDRRSGRGGPGRPGAARGHGPARAQERRPDRLPVVRPGRDRRDRGGPPGAGGVRRQGDPAAGRGDGLRGQRPGRGPRRRHRHRRRQEQGPPVRAGPERGGRARGRDGRRAGRVGDLHRRARRRRRPRAGSRRPATRPAGRPSATGPSCSASRAPTPTTASSASSSSASCDTFDADDPWRLGGSSTDRVGAALWTSLVVGLDEPHACSGLVVLVVIWIAVDSVLGMVVSSRRCADPLCLVVLDRACSRHRGRRSTAGCGPPTVRLVQLRARRLA